MNYINGSLLLSINLLVGTREWRDYFGYLNDRVTGSGVRTSCFCSSILIQDPRTLVGMRVKLIGV